MWKPLSNFIWFLTSIWEQFCILSCEKQHRGSQKHSELEQRVRSLQWFNRNFSCSHPVPRLTRSLSSPRAGVAHKHDSDRNKSFGMERCSNASSHRMEFLFYIVKLFFFSCNNYCKVVSSNWTFLSTIKSTCWNCWEIPLVQLLLLLGQTAKTYRVMAKPGLIFL